MPKRSQHTPKNVKHQKELLELPVLPRRDTVVYPRTMAQLVTLRRASQRAIEEALETNRSILVVGRANSQSQDFTFKDLHSIGTEGTVSRTLKMPDGSMQLWVQGVRRVRLVAPIHEHPYLRVAVLPIEEPQNHSLPAEALMRAVLALFEKCVKLSEDLPEENYVAAMNATEPGWLADLIASTLNLDLAQRQGVLDTLDPYERLQGVNLILAREVEIYEMKRKISDQVQQTVDKSHREFILKEQMRAIQKELGEIDPSTREMNDLKEKIAAAGMPQAVASKAQEELERLNLVPQASPEVGVIRTYLDWLISLPWNKETEDSLEIARAAHVLDQNHYGLKRVKERILEYLAVRKITPGSLRTPILCFVGPPGVGKTSLGKSIAEAIGRKFVRVSLGGIRDEAEIRGHRRTYVGALPGRIIQTMRTAGTRNPIFMLDEVDKVGMDFRGDPSSALLEVLDPEQNHSFSDHYLDVPFDLSRVMFITTANILDPVIPALKDRMEVIELPGYTEEEKLKIAQQFLVPKQLREHGLAGEKTLAFSEGAIRRIIREYSREAGVRNLDREIGGICRKVAKRVAEGQRHPRTITAQAVPGFLGPQKFYWGAVEEENEVGIATGVAWTEMGGDVLSVEVTLMEGKGNLILTGQLGEVMRESAQAALSYARSRGKTFTLAPQAFDKTDVHIHVPAGAIPKDGPSAGITMGTALISAFMRRAVRKEVAMTGEITLRGKVLPVGGIKEKVLAAHRAGIKTFILPKRNVKDLSEIPWNVKRSISFIPVNYMEEVLQNALVEGKSA